MILRYKLHIEKGHLNRWRFNCVSAHYAVEWVASPLKKVVFRRISQCPTSSNNTLSATLLHFSYFLKHMEWQKDRGTAQLVYMTGTQIAVNCRLLSHEQHKTRRSVLPQSFRSSKRLLSAYCLSNLALLHYYLCVLCIGIGICMCTLCM